MLEALAVCMIVPVVNVLQIEEKALAYNKLWCISI
jgi:hypothetical protein